MSSPEAARRSSAAAIWSAETRVELSELVAAGRETDELEFKALGDFRSCGNCEYCKARLNGPSREPLGRLTPPVPIAKAIASLPNTIGGVVVVGVKQVDRETDAHELEDVRCTGVRSARRTEFGQKLANLLSPPIPIEVKALQQSGHPTAFLLRVRESLSLVAWKDGPDGYCRYSKRRSETSVPMDSPEVE